MKRYPNWDILRLIAALDVVFIHWQTFLWPTPLRYGAQLDPVPTFVCLSGVLIPASFSASRNWQHFARKRILRVYPAFILSIVLVAVLFGPAAIWPTLLVYLTCGLREPAGQMNGSLWSLMAEEIFYTEHVISRLKRLWSPLLVCILLALSAAAWLATHSDSNANNLFRASTAFLVGNLAYFNLSKLDKISGWWFVAAFPALRIAQFLCRPIPFMELPLSSISAFLLVMGARNLPQVRWKMPDLSYGVYLYHWIVLSVAIRYLRHSPAELLLVTTAATLAVAAISWYAVESPALRLKNKPRPSSPTALDSTSSPSSQSALGPDPAGSDELSPLPANPPA